ncbi:MAG: sigma-70 family RNA polymerase sigma factor [Verrucomicrobia bacterium]|nr:sigma-70 family RNA polymerase sigma factor [Verrucomicrobiota bacterium]MDA1067158.1 sigma-70 family RNA polymerase sigma factor [Verrucomicrobiota bacterium]
MAAESATWQHYFKEWGPSLLLFARQQTGFLSEAEDIVQEAFIKIWKTYGHNGSINKSLFYAAVRTTAIDHARSNNRRKIREHKVFEDRESELELFERRLEVQERNTLLEDAIQQLSQDQQEVVVLKIWGELTFQEIANILDVSLNTAASRYRYALEHLKKEITPSLI